jgi:NAD(P)-dependent dehydrogenase (short-subunit alcohol dehydrogenase family)
MSTPGATPWEPGLAVVVGASGGVGRALCEHIEQHLPQLTLCRLGRRELVRLDLLDDESLQHARDHVAALVAQQPLRLFIDATGYLHQGDWQPEKSWRTLERDHLMHQFAINTVGPALLMKHFLPLMPRRERSVWATLSAKVGSIGDNRLGGWYSYRASKAALNMLLATAAIELRRNQPHTVVVALHPGTVSTGLSAPFRGGEIGRPPDLAAAQMLATLDGLTPADSGAFVAWDGQRLPW